MGKLILCVLLPCLLSVGALASGNLTAISGWLEFWVAASLGLLLSLPLERLGRPRLLALTQAILLLWALAPTKHNAATILVHNVILPAHSGISHAVQLTLPHLDSALDLTLATLGTGLNLALGALQDYMLAPVAALLGSLVAGGAVWAEQLVTNTPLYFWLAVEFCQEVLTEAPQYMETVLQNAAGWVVRTVNAVQWYAVSAADAVSAVVGSLVSRYRVNQRNPRLFSALFKQMIYQ